MKKAFTLIELLVVIAIIGSLSALFLPNFMAARERTRDSVRKSDLRQIQQAFELYKQDQNPQEYPDIMPSAGAVFKDSLNNIYMNKFPADPTAGQTYGYTVDNTVLTYTLVACLENTADPDGATCPVVAGFTCTKKCYIVNQP